MKIQCVWEHNGNDSILYSNNFVGAYTRGETKDIALQKMAKEIESYLEWKGEAVPDSLEAVIVQEKSSTLVISDADSDDKFPARHLKCMSIQKMLMIITSGRLVL